MSSEKYYYNDLKKKHKTRHKKDNSTKHCNDGCKVDRCESESTEYDYYNSREFFNLEVVQDADQFSLIDQESDELIWIKDSCDITVNTTDTQVAIGIQVAIQVAIAVVLRLTIADSEQNAGIFEELLQLSNIEQMNKQKIYIENSKDVEVITTDIDAALNVQLLLQVLVAIIVLVGIL